MAAKNVVGDVRIKTKSGLFLFLECLHSFLSETVSLASPHKCQPRRCADWQVSVLTCSSSPIITTIFVWQPSFACLLYLLNAIEASELRATARHLVPLIDHTVERSCHDRFTNRRIRRMILAFFWRFRSDFRVVVFLTKAKSAVKTCVIVCWLRLNSIQNNSTRYKIFDGFLCFRRNKKKHFPQ